MNQEMHNSWLHLEALMEKRHGAEVWGRMQQGMQSAFYMGALAALNSQEPAAALWKQCEAGLSDAMRRPLQIIPPAGSAKESGARRSVVVFRGSDKG